MTATNGMIAGIYNGWIAFRDSNGYPIGTETAPDDVSNGTTTHAYRIKHPISIGAPDITREIATRKGGQAIRGQRQLGVGNIGPFEMVLDAFDEQFHAYVSASAVDETTMTGWAITAPNTKKGVLPKFVLGMTVGFETEGGAAEYMNYIYSNVQIDPVIPGGSQDGGENPNPLTYQVTPDFSLRTGLGRLLSGMSLSVAEDSDLMIAVRNDKPITLTTYVDDNAAGTFTLGYRPTSDDETGAAENSITKNGTTTAVTSVAKTTGLVTQVAAGTAGDIWVVAYPTDYVAI